MGENMQCLSRWCICILCSICATLTGCEAESPSTTQQDAHEHGDAETQPVRLTVFSEKLELFAEYAPLVAGRPAEFLCHFTILETGQPVRLSALSVRAVPEKGAPVVAEGLHPVRDGIFKPSMTFAADGEYELEFTLSGIEVSDQFSAGRLTVWAGEQVIPQGKSVAPNVSTAPFLMEQQWKIGMRLARAERRDMAMWLEVPGELRSPPDASAHVASSKAGRILPPSSGRLPQLGEWVKAGQVLAQIEAPLLETAEVAERTLDLRQKAHGIDQEVARAKAALKFAQSEYERVSRLVASDTASERELGEARRERSIAEADVTAATAVQDWFASAVSLYPELRPTAESIESSDHAGRMSSLMPLTAPVTGEIVAVASATGEVVDALEAVFRIVDPQRLWMVAHVSEFDVNRLPENPKAHFSVYGVADRIFEVQASGGKLIHTGKQVDPESRTIALTYEMADPPRQLRPGMQVNSFLCTDLAPSTLVIPYEAVVREGGKRYAFVLMDGESFEQREVELGMRDRDHVQVLSGVSEGERVVTRGANALKMSLSSPATIGHGHVH
jgi:multidrug efflux pump subunit AcrA (membrane-fusion protein)